MSTFERMNDGSFSCEQFPRYRTVSFEFVSLGTVIQLKFKLNCCQIEAKNEHQQQLDINLRNVFTLHHHDASFFCEFLFVCEIIIQLCNNEDLIEMNDVDRPDFFKEFCAYVNRCEGV